MIGDAAGTLLRVIELRLASQPPRGIRSVKLDATKTFVVVRCDDGRAFVVEVREEHGAQAA